MDYSWWNDSANVQGGCMISEEMLHRAHVTGKWMAIVVMGLFTAIVLFLATCIGTLPVAVFLDVSLQTAFFITTTVVVVVEGIAVAVVALNY